MSKWSRSRIAFLLLGIGCLVLGGWFLSTSL